MKGMDEVGRLFNNNQLIVAEVLQSAEAMKAAVGHLEPHMEKADAPTRGKLLLATVKGDVHDIGKNLVEIILSNNGFKVVNLGIKVPPEKLIAAVKEHKPDIDRPLGPAREVRAADGDHGRGPRGRRGSACRCWSGGAALTKNFTYKRIRPTYDGLVAYARDAMQGLDLANQVMNPGGRSALDQKIAAEALQLGQADAAKAEPAAPAPSVRSALIRADEPARVPPDLERHVVGVPDLRALWPYVSPFMLYGKHLGVKGALDRLAEARDPKFLEIQEIVQSVQKRCEDGWMKARGLYQYFKANSDGNRLLIFDATGREIERFEFPRQAKPEGLCLSDFVRPAGSGTDYVAFFVTSTGEGIRARADQLKEKGEYVLSHTLQAVAIESAEGFAEKLHRDLRTWWGFPDAPGLSMNDRFKAKYQGVRVSFGYPACPNLADQEKLFRLLRPEEIGVQLTEGQMMDPEASVSALVFHHPQAEYFSVGPEA